MNPAMIDVGLGRLLPKTSSAVFAAHQFMSEKAAGPNLTSIRHSKSLASTTKFGEDFNASQFCGTTKAVVARLRSGNQDIGL